MHGDGFPPPAVVHEEVRCCVALVGDGDAADFIAQFDGEFDGTFGAGDVGFELQFGFAERAAIAGPGDDPQLMLSRCGSAERRHFDAAAVEAWSRQRHGETCSFRNDRLNRCLAIGQRQQALREGGRIAVIDAVAQPDDAQRRRAGIFLLQACQDSGAVGVEGARLQGCGFGLDRGGVGGLEALWTSLRSRCRERHGCAGALRAIENLGDDFLTLAPVLGGSPAVVDNQQQGRGGDGRDPARRVERVGDGNNEKGGECQAQQQQPPRSLVGLLLAIDQIEQQADWRELDGFRPRRRRTQQPPDDRQQRQGGKRHGCGEAQSGQEIHRLRSPEISACSIISRRVGGSSVR